MGLFSSCKEPNKPDEPWECLEDTTSHNFTWEIDSIATDLGALLPLLNDLNDMVAISEDDIWLVGEFHTSNPNGGTLQNHNAIHWDGEKWELLSIESNYRDQYYGFDRMTAILAFAQNDIWATFGIGAYAHWDGENWNSEYIWEIEGTPNGIWGTSSQNFYIVGYNGSITHYNGTSFTAMSSGTTTTLRHIFGLNEDHVWAISYYNTGEGIKNELIEYDGTNWSEIHHQDDWMENWPPQDYTRPSAIYLSTWAYDDTMYLGCASLWKESISTGEGYLMRLEQMDWNLMYGVGTITGNHCNDIFAFMAVGLGMTHYNGVSWQRDTNLQAFDPDRNIDIQAVTVMEDVTFIACTDYSSGRLLLIKGYHY